MTVRHYLTIQKAKNLFYHKECGLGYSSKCIDNPESYDLEDIYVAAVMHEDIQLSNTMLIQRPDSSQFDSKASISKLLFSFWNKEIKAYGLKIAKGMPTCLVIDHKIEPILTSTFFDFLKANNVAYEYSRTKDKRFIAKCHQHSQSRYYKNFEVSRSSDIFMEVKRIKGNMMENRPLSLQLANSILMVGERFNDYDYSFEFLSEIAQRSASLPPSISFPSSLPDLDFSKLNILKSTKTGMVCAESLQWVHSCDDRVFGFEFGRFLVNREHEEKQNAYLGKYNPDVFRNSVDFEQSIEALSIALKCTINFANKNKDNDYAIFNDDMSKCVVNDVLAGKYYNWTQETLISYMKLLGVIDAVITASEMERCGWSKPWFDYYYQSDNIYDTRKISLKSFRILQWHLNIVFDVMDSLVLYQNHNKSNGTKYYFVKGEPFDFGSVFIVKTGSPIDKYISESIQSDTYSFEARWLDDETMALIENGEITKFIDFIINE